MGIFQEHKEPTVFNFGIDETGSAYLSDTVRWTKFLAIMGFIFVGIMVLAAIGFSLSVGIKAPVGMSVYIFIYAVLACVYVYPTIALYQFSVFVKKAIVGNDSSLLNTAFRHQRNLYRYVGILLILTLLIYGFIAAYFAMISINR